MTKNDIRQLFFYFKMTRKIYKPLTEGHGEDYRMDCDFGLQQDHKNSHGIDFNICIR
jgi:hypothetical protein